jgi:steroid Delta-isomerase
MNMDHCPEPLRRLALWFNHLQPADLPHVERYYAPQASFKDPFNEVVGPQAIRGVFEHMYRTLDNPRFVVTGAVSQGAEAFLTWEFHFRFKRSGPAPNQVVRGSTHLRFDSHGLVLWHRDYWDVAEELYEKLPVVGSVMRWLKRRARSG